MTKYGGRRTVTLIPGDGVGPELTAAVKTVFRSATYPPNNTPRLTAIRRSYPARCAVDMCPGVRRLYPRRENNGQSRDYAILCE